MTFSEMKQALYDRLGLTGETTLVERLINNGKDRYQTAVKWPFLETSANQLFTSGTRSYVAPSDCRHILSVHDSTGSPLDGDIARETYDALYRGDTSTAATPTVFREEGAQSNGLVKFQVWPSPSANETGTIRYLANVPDLTSAGDNSRFDYIPPAHDFAVLEAAELAFHEYEDSPQASTLLQKWFATVSRLSGQDVAQPPLREND